MPRNKYIGLSLFSGALGLDLGLERAGIDVVVSQDYDPWCVRTIEANGRKVIGGDIRDITGEDLCERAGVRKEDVFLISGGPPCQPFSTAGARGSLNDPRGSLFMEFKRIIREVRPRFFVMENVKGLMSAPVRHIPHTERNGHPRVGDEEAGSAFQIVRNELLSLGYTLKHSVVDAVHYGVPQFRERLIILGSRDGEDLFIPIPTHFQKHQSPNHRWQTLRQAIANIESDPGSGARFSPARQRLLELVPEGGNWKSLPEEIIMGAMGGAYESAGGKVGFYRRLSYDQPSPTLVTSPVQKSTMLTHPTGAPPRPLSVREYARIQQFPDDWKFAGDINNCYRQIGNAVPVGLGRAIGMTLMSIAQGDSTIHAKRTRGTSVHNLGTLLDMASIDLFENNAIEIIDQLL